MVFYISNPLAPYFGKTNHENWTKYSKFKMLTFTL